jgi:carboxypeptidase family protein
MRLKYSVLFCALILIVAVQGAAAQANRATITGTVTDSSGAAVPGVDVIATNTGTNEATKTISNEDGIYVIPNLFPGQYSVEFQKTGFETFKRPSVTLESTERARIDAVLKVGAVTETITVSTDAPVLELEKASEGTNMKASVVNDLPLSIYGGGRFVEDFAVALTPGYSPVSSPYGAVVNGGQWFTKEYTIDGTSGTSNIQGDSMEAGPSMEAVQELQAETSGLDAQSSVTGGGVMSFNLKSGTNKFHGSAFLYGHNELLDANTWTNDYYQEGKPQERAWDYGFSLGGPIFKDKTFFFGTFERYQQVDFRLNGGSTSVPTPAMLGGNFQGLMGGTLCKDTNGNAGLCSLNSGTPIMIYDDAGVQHQAQENMIYDPNSGTNPLCPSAPCQFTNNTITNISPLAATINGFYKNYAPQSGGIDNNARGLIQNTPSQTPIQVVIKVDHTFREQDHLSGSWIYNHRPRTLDDGGGLWQAGTTNGGPLSNGRYQLYWVDQWRLSEAHAFNWHLLNVLNFTYNLDFNSSSPADPGNWNQQLGFGNTGANTFPIISFNDQNSAYGHNETFLGSTWQGNFSGVNAIIGDTLTWTKGRHSLSFGGNFAAHQINSRSGSGALSFDFPWWETSGPGYPYDGFGYATFLLGYVDKASETVPYNLYGRQKGMSLFAQDNYKVTQKLTLSMGLRWNYNFRFHEKYGRWANFDQTAIDPTYGIPGTLVLAKNGSDSFEKNEYARNFGPSLGFAYQMLPKTVVRGSFGLIFNPVGVAFFNGVPDQFAPQLGVNQVGCCYTWDSVPNGYAGVTKGATAGTDPTSIFPEVAVDPRALRLGYSEAFNFGIQQELTPNTRLEISYVGNRGHRLTDTALAWNQAPTSTFTRLWQLDAQEGYIGAYADYVCDAPTAAKYGVPYPYAGFCGPALAAAAPFPHMAQSEVNYWGYSNLNYVGLPLGQSFYDSLVFNVVKRMGRGLTMDLSYTWSKQEGDSFSAQQEYNGYYTPIQDFSRMSQAAHAVTGYDLTHIVKGFVSYNLPFGRGQRWASENKVVNGIVGGWTMAGIVNYYSGQPFHLGINNPYWPIWGNIYPQYNLAGYKGPNGTKNFLPLAPGATAVPPGNQYMPLNVAGPPAPGVLPPTPVNSSLRCPGQASENVTLLKNFTMGPEGQYRLSFRAEFYNLFNRHYYNINGCGGNNNNGIGAANFGQIYGVQDNPRQGQFAIRFEF